jgi:hypothetical protein
MSLKRGAVLLEMSISDDRITTVERGLLLMKSPLFTSHANITSFRLRSQAHKYSSGNL